MSDWDTVPITLRKRVPKGSAMKSEKVMIFNYFFAKYFKYTLII